MARIRTIKPEFWQDEKMAALDPSTRLVFLGLISMADDAGRMVDNVKSIDGFIFPETDESSRESLGILARLSRIIRYTSASGQKLIQIANWTRHQKVDKPNKYVLPAPTEQDIAAAQDRPITLDTRENVARASRDPLATTNDLRPTTSDLLPAKQPTAAAPAAAGDGPTQAEYVEYITTVREVWWTPDKLPPDGWTDRREASIYKQRRLKGEPHADLLRMVPGLRKIVDRGDLAEWDPPVRPGAKLTGRLLNNTHTGSRDVGSMALDAYFAEDKPPPKDGRRPEDVKRADFLAGIAKLKGAA